MSSTAADEAVGGLGIDGHKGQRHYSGTYWSATMRNHVIYESRLELARLIVADFDRSVHRILAQPFLLKAKVGGKVRKHVPDYLLVTDHGPVVVDVKPDYLLAEPTVAYTFAWTRRMVKARGWQYEVWSGASSPELENLRFLAGYRRPWLFDAALLDEVRGADMDGRTFGEVVRGLDGCDPAAARATVLHMLWLGESSRAHRARVRRVRPGNHHNGPVAHRLVWTGHKDGVGHLEARGSGKAARNQPPWATKWAA